MEVTKHSSFSDWIFLYYLAKNMEPYLFRNMLVDLARELRGADLNDATPLPSTDPARRRMIDGKELQAAGTNGKESLDEVDSKIVWKPKRNEIIGVECFWFILFYSWTVYCLRNDAHSHTHTP